MTSLLWTACSAALLALAFASAPPPAAAQSPSSWDTGRMQLTREELEALLTRYSETSESGAHSSAFRARARFEAALIRTRLREGDFQIGDQVTLSVEGEPELTGSFVVNPQRGLSLPVIGEIPLQGVLRAELQAHLTRHLERFIREPSVRTRSSIRLLVSGQVARPGYYVVDTETLLSDVLMQAGGPSAGARLTEIRVERGSETIWDGEALQQAIAEGRTMDQISLRAGDHLVIPADTPRGMSVLSRVVLTGLPAITLAVTTLMRIF
jgi:polysaccharide export outer membrane protein